MLIKGALAIGGYKNHDYGERQYYRSARDDINRAQEYNNQEKTSSSEETSAKSEQNMTDVYVEDDMEQETQEFNCK